MKVSVTLHTELPPIDGNQRTAEARYAGFNRAYATLEIQPDGNGVCKIEKLMFPAIQADPDRTPYTHYSIGVCEGIDPGKGGAIIIVGPLPPPMNLATYEPGDAPGILDELVGVYAARIAEMRADGRMGAGD